MGYLYIYSSFDNEWQSYLFFLVAISPYIAHGTRLTYHLASVLRTSLNYSTNILVESSRKFFVEHISSNMSHSQSNPVYYGSDTDEPIPGPSQQYGHPPAALPSPITPKGVIRGDITVPAQYLYDKLNSIEAKIDSVISRVSSLEQRQQISHDMLINIQRSIPRYTTPVIATHPSIERHLQ